LKNLEKKLEYSGSFVNGLYNGNGKLLLDNKIQYDGEYSNNCKHGYGKLYQYDTSNNFIIYEGPFNANRRHGDFIKMNS
jgi:hypothetical protein